MIPYIGGKSYLANWIISNFPSDYKSKTYCEVFGGGGWVLFKKEPSFVEIYNDLNSDLVNLFKTIRDNYPKFSHMAEWTLHSREMFQEATKKLQQDEFLSETERAINFATNRTQSFVGTGNSWGYQIRAHAATSGQWLPFLKRMELINARLKRVQIECLDFEKIIKKYDTPDTLFYLDPPYVDAEKYYDIPFTMEDHERLASLLKNIKGKFVLSYYDHPFIREQYSGYQILTKEVSKHSYGMTVNAKSKERPKGKEVLILNY
ncbi:MAG: DNA adenine methylase [Acidobacteriota bacterium]